MTRRPVFWILFAVLGLAGAVTAMALFTVALPVVSLEIDMDRGAAIDEAAALADSRGWGPEDARSAASFGQVDPEVQTYVELEGGGRDVFQELMDGGVHHPYQWRVRRFAEGEVEEVEVRFTPAGAAYGFEHRLAEGDPGGGNLDEDVARALAEREAAAWPVDLASYELIESSDEVQPGGRVDHTFVYQRTDVQVEDARFRLRLVVAGDRLSELTHFVFVPQAFSRRYADMRSTNDGIALVAQGFVILIYVLLGAGVGTAFLLRRRWIEWRTPVLWGAVTAVLFGLNTINALPLAWMGYDTAVSAGTFVLRNIAAAGAIALLGTPVLAFFFLAAESLGRRAFPDHLQQWRFWSPEVAASQKALGLTVAAYLLVGIQVGYVVLFYLVTSRLEGWWSPADALVQPDLLATYFPWLQAVSLSLFASLWEESVFRAVPIACAALIGTRLGHRSAWIWGAVLLQAVVFAAGHANYPQQPPYARVVELTAPALAWGAIYVFYGLVPTILAHFLYDLALISSVLFSSEAVVDQAVIVGVGAIPLAVVVWARRRRAVGPLPEWAYNRAWSPPRVEETSARAGPEPWGPPEPTPVGSRPDGTEVPAGASEPAARRPSPLSRPLLASAGVVGLALWATALAIRDETPRLEIGRGEAIEIAEDELERRGHDLAGWSASATTGDGRSEAHEYVAEEAGRDVHDALFGTFLPPPQWIVRFVDWSATPEERVEALFVNVGADGSIRRVAHALPEARPGADLDEDSALALARAALPPGSWNAIGAEESTHVARTDWTFTFVEPSVLDDVGGEGRASVRVLGDEVTDVRRFVHVPEEWQRARREAGSRREMISLGLLLVLGLLFATAAVVAVVRWSRHTLRTAPLWKAAVVVSLAALLSSANGWPAATALLSTTQPYGIQAGAVAFGLLLVAIVSAAAIALVVALGHTWAVSADANGAAFTGVGVGLLVGGVAALVRVVASALPPLPNYAGAAAYVPALAPALDSVMPFVLLTAAALVLATAHRRFADRAGLRGVTAFAIAALGVVAVPDALQDSLVAWAPAAVGAALVVWGLVRLIGVLPATAPPLVATVLALGQLRTLVERPYPVSSVGAALAVAALAVVAWAWCKELAAQRSRG